MPRTLGPKAGESTIRSILDRIERMKTCSHPELARCPIDQVDSA